MNQNGCYISPRKTTLIEVDEGTHKVPPDGGPFSEFKVADYFCPEEWSKDGIFIAVQEGQPMWFDLSQNDECACLVSVQRLNPVTGEPVDLEQGLTKDPKQNYLCLPQQQWLDGYAKDGKVYQFIVTKAGIGLAVNEFVLPKFLQDSHAMAFAFFPPKVPKPKVVEREVLTSGGSLRGLLRDKSLDFAPHHTPRPIWHLDSPERRKIGGHYYAGGTGGLDRLCGSPIGSVGDVGEAGADYAEEVAEMTCMSMGTASAEGNITTKGLDSVAEESALAAADEFIPETDLAKASMGMGGRIKQRIVTDENTVDYYLRETVGVLTIYLALPAQFEAIMKKGKRQDAEKKDKYIASGQVGGVQIPLIGKADIS